MTAGKEPSNSADPSFQRACWFAAPLRRCRRFVGRAYGYGSKLHHQGTAGFGPCFHLPGFHFGNLFLTHSPVEKGCFCLKRLRSRTPHRRFCFGKLPSQRVAQADRDHAKAPKVQSGREVQVQGCCTFGFAAMSQFQSTKAYSTEYLSFLWRQHIGRKGGGFGKPGTEGSGFVSGVCNRTPRS